MHGELMEKLRLQLLDSHYTGALHERRLDDEAAITNHPNTSVAYISCLLCISASSSCQDVLEAALS